MSGRREPFADLTRENMNSYLPRRLRAGGGSRPALLLVQDQGKLAVVKDYRASGWLLRASVGPWLITREARIYASLAGAPGVPRLLRVLDRHALVVAHVAGRNCAQYPDGGLPPEFFDRLQQVVEGLHARGVVHCDIKNRSNIVVADSGQPYLIDFASAFSRNGSFGPLRRAIFERFRMDDLRAVTKARILVARVSTDEQARFAFHRTPAERAVRAVRNAARWLFKLMAGG
jgi:hypothetical protein